MNSRRFRVMALRTLLLALSLGLCLITIPAAFAADTGSGCAQNQALDTAHYAAALKGDAHNFSAAIFQQVPSDLTIAAESATYVVQSDTAKRALPLESALAMDSAPSGERVVASCRVKGPAGDWWLAQRSITGSLVYVAESKAQKLGEGTAEVKPEPRIKEPNSKY